MQSSVNLGSLGLSRLPFCLKNVDLGFDFKLGFVSGPSTLHYFGLGARIIEDDAKSGHPVAMRSLIAGIATMKLRLEIFLVIIMFVSVLNRFLVINFG